MTPQPLSALTRIIIQLALLLLLAISATAAENHPAPSVKVQDNVFRFTYESIDMPAPDDRMGLLGFNYLTELTPNWSLGVGGYGSVSGDRGGFFTGGLAGGYRYRLIDKLWFDSGLFVGGGGGGAAAQGGGLMLRAHAGLLYDFDGFRIGAAYSAIDFPNGEIESQHLALSLEIPFTSITATHPSSRQVPTVAEISLFTGKPLQYAHQEILLKSRRYLLSGSTRTTSGARQTDDLQLIGVEYRRFLSRPLFLLAEALGAFSGEADGYAEVMFGLGGRFPLAGEKLNLLGSLAAGGAGGGGIDTGGGAALRAELDLEYQLAGQSVIALGSGYYAAVDGHASGWILGIKYGSQFQSIGAGAGAQPVLADDRLSWTRWRLRATHQTYFEPERLGAGHAGRDVQLVGAKIDYFLRNNLYLTGQAAGAYEGEAGGYAVGLVGLGWQGPRLGGSRWQPLAELLAGAGGGGGIDVGEGALVQPLLGIEYRANDRYGLQLMAGRVVSFDGGLNATTIELSLCYRFTRLARATD